MKNVIKKIFNTFGIDVIRYDKNKRKKTVKTNKLSYYKTKTGNYYLPTDAYQDIVVDTIKRNKIFEKEVVDIARNYIRKGTVVLDIGANFGQMSVLFADLVGDEGIVHSFDADDWIYEILIKNIKANNKNNIIPHFGAVHNIAGEKLIFPEQDFKEFGAYGAYGIDYNAKSGRVVTSITIDDLNIKEKISFMKIDIQGGDLQAMQGSINTILKNKMPILFEYEYHFENKYNMCFQEYVDFVNKINYKFHKVVNGHNFLIIPK
jgi:FkbM family methyltransferase